MGGVLKVVGGGIGGIVDAVTGSTPKQKSSSERSVAEMTPEERQLQQYQQKLIQDLIDQQGEQADPELQAEFRKLLFGTLTSNGQVSPEQMKAAASFVDETFTKPAQQQFEVFAQDFLAKQGQRTAVAGRQATDPAIAARAFAGLVPAQAQLAAQRGQLVGQEAQRLQQQPYQQLQAGLTGLNYFNNLQQQALANRIGLSNLLTQQQQMRQQERFQNVKQYGEGFIKPTMGQRIGGFSEGLGGIAGTVGGLFAGGAAGGGMGSGAGALGQTGLIGGLGRSVEN